MANELSRDPGSTLGSLARGLGIAREGVEDINRKRIERETKKQDFYNTQRNRGVSAEVALEQATRIFGSSTNPVGDEVSDARLDKLAELKLRGKKAGVEKKELEVKKLRKQIETGDFGKLTHQQKKDIDRKMKDKARRAKLLGAQTGKVSPSTPFETVEEDVSVPGKFGIGTRKETQEIQKLKFNAPTFKVIKQMNTVGDLEDLIQDQARMKANGVDVQAILDFFLIEEE